MKHFIEIYDEATGVMLAKVAGKTQPECNVRALEMLKTHEGPCNVWFVDPKTGTTAKHFAGDRVSPGEGIE